MVARCDHCDAFAELADVGHGIHYCLACQEAERRLIARQQTKAPTLPGKWVNQHGEGLGRRNAYIGERQGPLTAGDKAHLCILAREAFIVMHEREPVNQTEFDQWRREQQLKACGFGSLRHCDQRHRADLESHFLNLKGESARAFKRQMKGAAGNVSVALAVLRQNLQEFGLHEGYAAVICRSKCKCELSDASVRQLWVVIFQLRKNQQRKRRKGLPK